MIKTRKIALSLTIMIFSLMSISLVSSVNITTNTIKIGDIISFGAHTWQVLDIQKGLAFIISEDILELKAYQTNNNGHTWAESSLREYLNGEFYNSNAFSNDDRLRIVQVTNVNDNNQMYEVPGGENTQDRIFLMSIAEAVLYFGDSGYLEYLVREANLMRLRDRSLMNMSHGINDRYNPNRLAIYKGIIYPPAQTVYYNWWLRSPGSNISKASLITAGGIILMSGLSIDIERCGVRPALWIYL